MSFITSSPMELHKWGESKQATHFIFNTVRKPLDGILELQIPGEGGYWHAFLLNKTLYVAAVSSASAEEEGDVFPAFVGSVHNVEKAAGAWLKRSDPEISPSVTLTYQLYFSFYLIGMDTYYQRPDLSQCGRTLQGFWPSDRMHMQRPGVDGFPSRALFFLREVEDKAAEMGIGLAAVEGMKDQSQFSCLLKEEKAVTAVLHKQMLITLLKSLESSHALKVLLHPEPFEGLPPNISYGHWRLYENDKILFESLHHPTRYKGSMLLLNNAVAEAFHNKENVRISVVEKAVEKWKELHLPESLACLHRNASVEQLERELHVLSDLTINYYVSAAVKHVNLILENLRGLKETLPPEACQEASATQLKVVSITMGYVNELRLLVHDMLEALKNPETIEEKGPELMAEVRKRTDHLEMIVDQALWPVPKYREILFLT
ncbi:MAG: hypothetical protein WBK97_02915 [Bacteroidales bacterium]